MEGSVFVVVIFAALLHAVWNAVVKHAEDKYLSMTAVVIGHSPLAVLSLTFAPFPPLDSWIYIISGAILHICYQFFLLYSYKMGDFTQVYPIARGTAPIAIVIISSFFLEVEFNYIEISAVLLICCGLASLAFVRGSNGLRNSKAAMSAMVTGLFIAGYSLTDGLGARQAGTALGFYACLSIINAIVFALLVYKLKPRLLERVLTEGRFTAVFGGAASFTAFALVVWAFTQAPIALVSALREVSIVFALIIGVVIFKERVNLAKVVSTTATLFGAIILRFSK